MGGIGEFRDVLVFVAAYLLLSVPPFLVLRWARLSALRTDPARHVVALAVLGTAVVLLLAFASVARSGVTRYVAFLRSPTDCLSVLVALAFVVAATSWWLVPLVDVHATLELDTQVLLGLIVAAHAPLTLFLSLCATAACVNTGR